MLAAVLFLVVVVGEEVEEAGLFLVAQDDLLLTGLLVGDGLGLEGQAFALLPLDQVALGLGGVALRKQHRTVHCAGAEVGVVRKSKPDLDGGRGGLATDFLDGGQTRLILLGDELAELGVLDGLEPELLELGALGEGGQLAHFRTVEIFVGVLEFVVLDGAALDDLGHLS